MELCETDRLLSEAVRPIGVGVQSVPKQRGRGRIIKKESFSFLPCSIWFRGEALRPVGRRGEDARQRRGAKTKTE